MPAAVHDHGLGKTAPLRSKQKTRANIRSPLSQGKINVSRQPALGSGAKADQRVQTKTVDRQNALAIINAIAIANIIGDRSSARSGGERNGEESGEENNEEGDDQKSGESHHEKSGKKSDHAKNRSENDGEIGHKSDNQKAAAPKAAKSSAKKAKRTLNPALKAPYTPSTQLAMIVGESPLPRQEVVSKLWKYIKKNGLQDRQNINADDLLKPIFGNKKTVTMFEMQKHVSKHLTKA